MTAQVNIDSDKRLDLIALAAGQPDPDQRWYKNGVLYVGAINQSALDNAVNNPAPIPQFEYAKKAQAALDASDMTALRCFKSGVSFPTEWQSYVTSLRAIVNGANGPLPTRPSYPQGT